MKPPRNRHETASQARTERVDAAAGAALMLLLGLSVALFFIRPMLRHVAELSAPTPPTLRQEFQAGYYPFVCGVNKFPQHEAGAKPPGLIEPGDAELQVGSLKAGIMHARSSKKIALPAGQQLPAQAPAASGYTQLFEA